MNAIRKTPLSSPYSNSSLQAGGGKSNGRGLLVDKGKWVLFLLWILVPVSIWGQTQYAEKAQLAGLDHFYLNTELMGGGIAWFDYDNDGWEDMWITGGVLRDKLFRNKGDGTFSESGISAGLGVTTSVTTHGVVTGDIDNDGDRDVFVTTSVGFHNLLFLNNGNGTFQDISVAAKVAQDSVQSMTAAFGDLNLDGYLDIYVGNYVQDAGVLFDSITGQPNGFDHTCFPNFFYLNNGPDPVNGAIIFSEVNPFLGLQDTGCALATVFTDFDNDHDPDILVANDFGEWVVPNQLYRNEYPAQQVTNISQSSGLNAEMYGMGIAIGDYDQDMDLDYYITNIGRNGLFQNQSNGTFVDVTTAAGVEDIDAMPLLTVGWGTIFADMDNDTDLDLLVTNGHVPALPFIDNNFRNPDRFFLNVGNGTFVEKGALFGVRDTSRGRGSAAADYDQDGDLDYLVVPVNEVTLNDSIENVRLYQNELSGSNNWLQVKLIGVRNNRDGYGAHIKIILTNRSWIHEVTGGSSHGSQNSSIAHFGLGTEPDVDSLVVIWPGGAEQVLTSISPNQLITVIEDTSLTSEQASFIEKTVINLSANPNPFTKHIYLTFTCPKPAEVKLVIYSYQGQKIRTIYQGRDCQGEQQFIWDGENDQGQKMASGIYFAKLSQDLRQYTLPLIKAN